MRGTHDSRGGVNPLVDHMVGTAYDDVKCVARNIEIIKQLSYHMEEIYNVSGNIEDILLLAEAVNNLSGHITITAHAASGLTGGNIQTVLQALSARVRALES